MTEIRPAAQNRARRVAKAEKIAVRTVSGFVKAVFLIGFCFAVLYPLMTILSKSFMGRMDLFDNTVILVPKTFTLQNYQIAAMLMGYGEALVNTVTLSTIVMLLETASCLLVAYGLARFRFRLRGLFLVLVVFTLIVPPQLILVPMVVQFSRYDPLGICTLLFGGSLNLIDSFLPFGLLAATAVGNGAEYLAVALPDLRKVLAVERAADDLAIAVGVRRDGPALADRAIGDLVTPVVRELAPAPDLLVEDRLEENQLMELLRHCCSFVIGYVVTILAVKTCAGR